VRVDIVTIFPEMVERALATGVIGRAIERGMLQAAVHDLRGFTTDRHRVVDDVPYGGGPGMVMKPEPIVRAIEALGGAGRADGRVILTSPQGTPFTQRVAERLSGLARLTIICGRYEGVDERVRLWVDEELSIGDYVLSGGELAALVVTDAVARCVPGVVGDAQSVAEDSFSRGVLDYPQYTRPAELTMRPGAEVDPARLRVPEVLVSGHHAEIRRWRRREALARTLERRPELVATAALDEDEREILRELEAQRKE
jgi:tRNA (guanine37-N1)-methyltransferase